MTTHIKKLKIQGFKSFAKPTEVIFDRNFSVILGPNGAGKSNITDAICFVLGRLGMKSLRAERASNLIYNGGKVGNAAKEASVELVLDNSAKLFSLDNPEVKITRIVREKGISIYKINDETKTRQEVLELLAQADIDPEGFNIILQEEIAKFVEMHPEERREVIEEVAGISIYEERKGKSLRELEKTDEKLKEVGTILNERISYLKNLDKERAQALKYANLRKYITRDKATLVFKRLQEKKKEAEKINSKISEEEQKTSKVKSEISKLQEKISNLNIEIDSINKEIEKATGLESEKLHSDIAQTRAEIAAFTVRLENFNEQLANLNERELQLQETIKKTGPEIEQLKKEKEKSYAKEIDLPSLKQELNLIAASLKNANESLIQLFSEFSRKISLLKSEFSKGKIRAEKIAELLEIIGENQKKSVNILEKLEQNSKELSKLTGARIGEGKNFELEISIREKEIERIKLILKRSIKEKSELEGRISELRGELGIKEKHAVIQEKNEKELYTNFQKLFNKRTALQDNIKQHEQKTFDFRRELHLCEDSNNSFKIAKAKIDAELESLESEYSQYQEVELNQHDSLAELENKIKNHEQQLLEIGGVNMRALEIYDKVKEEYEGVAERVTKLEQEKQEILNIITEIDKKKKKIFMKTLVQLNETFSNNFASLSAKTAFLALENEEDPFSGGLDIRVRIAKGKYLDVSSLSGGERALVALSLIFSIQALKPYHFYILDEIDASLDKRNSERLATLIKDNIKNAQYIIISHNDSVINQGNVLYGVSMQDGISKVLSLKV